MIKINKLNNCEYIDALFDGRAVVVSLVSLNEIIHSP
jgi:hypothetical protein